MLTPDLLLHRQVCTCRYTMVTVPSAGFEPATPSTGNWCTNPLCYEGKPRIACWMVPVEPCMVPLSRGGLISPSSRSRTGEASNLLSTMHGDLLARERAERPRPDSNRQPSPRQGAALAIAPRGQDRSNGMVCGWAAVASGCGFKTNTVPVERGPQTGLSPSPVG